MSEKIQFNFLNVEDSIDPVKEKQAYRFHKDEVDLLTEQYFFFHNYSTLQAPTNRYSIVSFSLTAILAVFAAIGFSNLLSSAILFVFFLTITQLSHL